MGSDFDPMLSFRVAEADLGPVLSAHRRKFTSLAGLIFSCLCCFAIGIALAVNAAYQSVFLEILKRAGMAAIFLAGGGLLVWGARRTVFTRVHLAEKGLLYTYGETTVARWEDIGTVEFVRVFGRLASLSLHVKGKVLLVGAELSGFSTIVRALKAHGVLRRDFVE